MILCHYPGYNTLICMPRRDVHGCLGVSTLTSRKGNSRRCSVQDPLIARSRHWTPFIGGVWGLVRDIERLQPPVVLEQQLAFTRPRHPYAHSRLGPPGTRQGPFHPIRLFYCPGGRHARPLTAHCQLTDTWEPFWQGYLFVDSARLARAVPRDLLITVDVIATAHPLSPLIMRIVGGITLGQSWLVYRLKSSLPSSS